MSRCIPTDAQAITLGVDTHKDFHVAVALDGIGRHRGTLSVLANLAAGYKRLVDWAEEFGPLKHAGVEGTGSFGAGLSRFLKGRRIKVSEVKCPPPSDPPRQPRRQQGAIRDRRRPHEPRRAYPILRGKVHRRGQDQEGDHPLPQEIHCPRDLPGPLLHILTQTLDFGALKNIEASPVPGEFCVLHPKKVAKDHQASCKNTPYGGCTALL